MPRLAAPSEDVLKAMIKAGPGVAVRYWPIWVPEYQAEFKDTVTRSEPWMLGHGEWVVSIKGQAGGVAVSHCALLPLEGKQGPVFRRA